MSGYAWGATAAAGAFVAITCWWLTQDRSIPIYDAGSHLQRAIAYHDMLRAGNLLGPITNESLYPPLGYLVGALAMFVGGVSVASAVIGANLVFVSLLALGCYQIGRLLYGPLAGMLSVAFALSAPLVSSLFHVFILDSQLTAVVAVSIWLILASEDFKRTRIAALAGLAVGVGMNVKAQMPLYVAGPVAVALVRGGWRNRRGCAAFAIAALAFGLPWYLVHAGELARLSEFASGGFGTPAGNIQSGLSATNVLWYFWSILNTQLLAPLFALLVAGAIWTAFAIVRGRERSGPRLDLLIGCVATWALITFATSHHDTRYGLPLLPYLAVIGTGWITLLSRPARTAAIALLALGASANVLGVDFGVGGGAATLALSHPLPQGEQHPGRVVAYTTEGFLASAPSRDGDVPGLLSELRRAGVRKVVVSLSQSQSPDFSYQGIAPLAQIAGLAPYISEGLTYSGSASSATLIHESTAAFTATPCTRLSDGTGVWVVRYDAAARTPTLYCPSHRPQFYDRGAVK